MEMTADEVIRRRLAMQHLTSTPLPDPVEAVKLLLCAQSQDAPLARYSLGLRVTESTDAVIRAAQDEGRLIRTHILRPTWHFVAAEDLHWVLALTSDKVLSSLASRHRQLAINPRTIERAHEELVSMLGGRQFMTAAEVGERFTSLGFAISGEAVRHLLLIAELRGLVCSGPLRGPTHTYGLVDDVIAPAPALDRQDAARQLVHRFFRGHGPASDRDLRRWTTLTLTEIRRALAELDDVVETASCNGEDLWFDSEAMQLAMPSTGMPSALAGAELRRRVALLPTFDEAYLPYRSVGVSRISGHPRGDKPHSFAEAGGGVVIVDRGDAGWWKRTVSAKTTMTVRLGLATGLDAEQRRLITVEATALAAFFDLDVNIEMADH